MSIVECKELWGGAHLMYGEPAFCYYEDAAFIPYEGGRAWGLFDASRQMITEGLDLRGSERTPHQSYLNWEPTELEQAPDETYVYCGWINPHYGHFLINSLPKFWPLFSKNLSGAKIILASSPFEMPEFASTILGRLGLEHSSMITFTKPVSIRNIYVPSAALLEQYWIYTIYRDLCQKASRGLWDLDEIDSINRPVYLSKAKLKTGVGKIENEVEIERIFSLAGVDIAYPETMDWIDQVRMFAKRRYIVGPTGSAFHTAIFAPPGRNILCFNPSLEINSNFRMIDLVSSNNSQYFFQRGMTYGSSGDFLTIVRPENAIRLGEELVDLLRSRHSW